MSFSRFLVSLGKVREQGGSKQNENPNFRCQINSKDLFITHDITAEEYSKFTRKFTRCKEIFEDILNTDNVYVNATPVEYRYERVLKLAQNGLNLFKS